MNERGLIFHPDCYKELKKLDGTQRQWAMKVLKRLKDPNLIIEQILSPMGDRDGIELSGTFKGKNRSTGMRMVIREVDFGQAKANIMVDESGKKLSIDQINKHSVYVQSIAVGQKDDNKKVYKAAAKRYFSLRENE